MSTVDPTTPTGAAAREGAEADRGASAVRQIVADAADTAARRYHASQTDWWQGHRDGLNCVLSAIDKRMREDAAPSHRSVASELAPEPSDLAAGPGVGAVPAGKVRDYLVAVDALYSHLWEGRAPDDELGLHYARTAMDLERARDGARLALDAILSDPAPRRAEGVALPDVEALAEALNETDKSARRYVMPWSELVGLSLNHPCGPGPQRLALNIVKYHRDHAAAILARLAGTAAPRAGGDDAPDLASALARLRSAHKLPDEMTDTACVTHAADHELDREIILAGAQRNALDQQVHAARYGLERDGALALLADLAVAGVVSHGQITRATRLDALEVRAAVADAEERACASKRGSADTARSPDAPAGAALTREAEGLSPREVAEAIVLDVLSDERQDRVAVFANYRPELDRAETLIRSALASTAGGDGAGQGWRPCGVCFTPDACRSWQRCSATGAQP